MKDSKFKYYIYWGLTALAVVAISVAFVFFLSRFDTVKKMFHLIINVLMPVIYGAVLAYLMLPVYNKFRKMFYKLNTYYIKGESRRDSIAKGAATAVCLVVIIVVVSGLFRMLIPQIYESIINLQNTLEGNVTNLTGWLTRLLSDNPSLEAAILPYYEQVVEAFRQWLVNDLLPSLSSNMSLVISGVSSGLISVVVVLKNILIGLIVMVYFLNSKDTFAAQGKKIVYSVAPLRKANLFVEEMRFIHKVFGGFITGKLLDSLIIGIICFFCLSLLNMPYTLLVSVIVGVTNVIPFFGPFIGAIPSAFLILMVSPIKCLYFLIFILILQQFDGNILGPKILGDSTGLPSFWVLFSILLFGGLFGFVGMIVAVPAFAVFYSFLSGLVGRSLRKRSLSDDTKDYMELDHIDEDNKNYIK